MFFRGFLLFGSIAVMGIPLAVSLNVLLYVLLHLFNSKKEMLACIPFGLLLCWLSVLFNAAWPAMILHACFSLLYEIRIYQSIFTIQKTAQS
jgi:membrane protease YdiL (CAAX protease family)